MSTPSSVEENSRLTTKQRYQQFIEQARKTQQVWTLSDEQGCLIIETGDEKVLLLWSEQALAEHWASKDHSSFNALAISLSDLTEKWLPGMANDGFDVAVAPSFAGEGTIVAPLDLADELSSGKIK
ncbi:DUF2750 domain-containing protein [Agarivorans sp. 1_MG-2023]|uniref:DUF2750 domain-containing protein n=1 Tax=Agarivorans sp. 1_MG-2023 TaxID=3062634 RepID=UPI0026E24997|nr:DUF2750 domain-containing protein [Agarivorans sp. 1_MG-2023]MDO6763642.1 DUF2750 domain-containing protein [Agarivorans sp. 1_MG-2023]